MEKIQSKPGSETAVCPGLLEREHDVPAFSVEALISRQIDPAVKRTVDTLNTMLNETRQND